ncbi:unnamed protein product [Ectocarpus sp. 6 AP-2014]
MCSGWRSDESRTLRMHPERWETPETWLSVRLDAKDSTSPLPYAVARAASLRLLYVRQQSETA